MVNGTLLNFGKRYEDNLRVIFDVWPKLHLGLDALSNQNILNGIYYICGCIVYGLCTKCHLHSSILLSVWLYRLWNFNFENTKIQQLWEYKNTKIIIKHVSKLCYLSYFKIHYINDSLLNYWNFFISSIQFLRFSIKTIFWKINHWFGQFVNKKFTRVGPNCVCLS